MASNPAERLDQLLADLAPMYTTATQGAARFVVGPSGVFVLVPSGDDVGEAAHRAARLADATRAALAEHIAWVPFVDAVVVTSADRYRKATTPAGRMANVPATAVPLDLLGEMLVEGRSVVADTALRSIRSLLQHDELAPWRAGREAGAAKIDLCEPAADTSATA